MIKRRLNGVVKPMRILCLYSSLEPDPGSLTRKFGLVETIQGSLL